MNTRCAILPSRSASRPTCDPRAPSTPTRRPASIEDLQGVVEKLKREFEAVRKTEQGDGEDSCALRRAELAELEVGKIQQREGRWVICDLRGKGGRVRTVAIPIWVESAIDVWMAAASIKEGRLLLPVLKGGKIKGDMLTDWSIWSVVEQSAKEIGIERFGAHDLRRRCAKLCRKSGGDLEQIKFLLGHSSI